MENKDFEDKAVIRILAALISQGASGSVDGKVIRAYQYVDELLKQRSQRQGQAPLPASAYSKGNKPK